MFKSLQKSKKQNFTFKKLQKQPIKAEGSSLQISYSQQNIRKHTECLKRDHLNFEFDDSDMSQKRLDGEK